MHLHQILLKLSRQPFFPIWFALTVAAFLFTVWLLRKSSAAFQAAPSGAVADWPTARQRGLWLAVGVFCLFVAAYVGLIFAWEDFAYYDNSQFTLFSLRGINFRPSIWIDSGRFFPLGSLEYNVVAHLSHNIAAYHALAVLQLLFVCAILLVLDRDLPLIARVGLATCVLLAPSILICFGGLIYPDRNVIFWLACLLFFVARFDRTQSLPAALAAIISAQCMLYYKESAFLLLCGFAAGRLLLRCQNAQGGGWNMRRLDEPSSRLDFLLGALGVIFVVYYVAIMFHHTRFQYAQQQRMPESEVLLLYLKTDFLVYLFAVVAVVRAFLVVKQKIVPSPFWEGLAWGALAYFASFLYLSMFSVYYLVPVDLIAVLYLGRLVIQSWPRQPISARIGLVTALCVVLAQNIFLSTLREYDRKNLIHAKSEMAGVIQTAYQHHSGAPLRLFFPFTSPYNTMEFGAYLSYRGIPVEEAGKTVSYPVLIVNRAMQSDGKIQDYRNILGHAGQIPQPGDLVVVLPDDEVSDAEAAPYQDGGDQLFHYKPAIHPPQGFWPLVKQFHFVLPAFERKPLPDHWLNASITIWKGSNEHNAPAGNASALSAPVS
jgi:hypothetical protein